MQSPQYVQNQDEEHLRLLALFHRILGGIAAVFALCPGLYVFLGAMSLGDSTLTAKGHAGPPTAFGVLFIVFGGVLILMGWAFAICVFSVGGRLERRTHYGFCFAMACIECLFQPLGTALGVFLLVVLLRPSVKALFASV
jgi:hypothetical protein